MTRGLTILIQFFVGFWTLAVGSFLEFSGMSELDGMVLTLWGQVMYTLGMALLLAAVCAALMKDCSLQKLGLRTKVQAPISLILVGTLGLQCLGTAVGIILSYVPLESGSLPLLVEFILQGWQESPLLTTLSVAVAPGFLEELMFRGYLLQLLLYWLAGLGRRRAAMVALLLSSVAFGIFHYDPVHSLVTTMMGLYLGILMLRIGNLWIPIAIHALNNFVSILWLVYLPEEWLEDGGTMLAVGVAGGLLAFTALSLVFVYRRMAAGERPAPGKGRTRTAMRTADA